MGFSERGRARPQGGKGNQRALGAKDGSLARAIETQAAQRAPAPSASESARGRERWSQPFHFLFGLMVSSPFYDILFDFYPFVVVK